MTTLGAKLGTTLVIAATLLGSTAAATEAGPAPSAAAVTAASETQSRALFRVGLAHYAAGRYPDAIEAFLRARALFANPVLSFNIGSAYEKLGDSAGALGCYRDYLRQAPTAADRAQVQQKVGELERALQVTGVQQVTVLSEPEGAAVHLDGLTVGVTPWTGELRPGSHHLVLSLAGHASAERGFRLLPHRALDVSAELEATPPIEPVAVDRDAPAPNALDRPPRARHDRAVRPLTYVTFGIGLGAWGGAGVFEGLRRESADDVKEQSTQIARHDAYTRMESQRQTALILAGVGAGVTLVGATLLIVDLSRGRARRDTAVTCGPQGCSVQGSFL